eukprot:NODE_243_length_11887_cov_0.520699.p2 type:complete len:457 gc:universal NODE_243_length_11887_cov_0.520699:5637-4267(-)
MVLFVLFSVENDGWRSWEINGHLFEKIFVEIETMFGVNSNVNGMNFTNHTGLKTLLDKHEYINALKLVKSDDLQGIWMKFMIYYKMQDYDECDELLSILECKYNQNMNEFKEILMQRKRERDFGEYQFESMFKEAQDQFTVNVSDYVRNVEIVETMDQGRGLCAAQDYKCGDLILVNKAIAYAQDSDNQSGVSQLKSKVYEMANDPFKKSQIQQLYICNEPTETLTKSIISDLVDCNAFTLGPYHPEYHAIFSTASLLNHSCLPNCFNYFIGDIMVIRALRDIKMGESLTLKYILTHKPLINRQNDTAHYQFICLCDLCEFDHQFTLKYPQFKQMIEEYHDLSIQVTNHDQIDLFDDCLRALNLEKGDAAMFRKGVLLHYFIDATPNDVIYETINEILYCFKPELNHVICGTFLQYVLWELQHVPKYKHELQKWADLMYYKGYPIVDVCNNMKNNK